MKCPLESACDGAGLKKAGTGTGPPRPEAGLALPSSAFGFGWHPRRLGPSHLSPSSPTQRNEAGS